MSGSQEIRTQIASIQNTQKITKAMEMVAASKMKKAQDQMTKARPYADKILNVINKNTMFFNASIQGLYRTSRVFFEQPVRAAGLVSTTIVAPSVALYYLNSIHDEYALVPDRIKQLNYGTYE